MSVNNKLIDIEKLSRYHENLKEVLNTKEAAGEAAKAEAAAKKYADEEIAKLSFDEAGAAGEAYEAAKDYADDLVKNEDGSVKFDDKHLRKSRIRDRGTRRRRCQRIPRGTRS